MANCKNHTENKAIYRCVSCGVSICYNCYNQFQITLDRKEFGFCSEECKEKYKELIKENRNKYRQTAFSFLRKALYSFFITIIFFIAFNPLKLFIENGYGAGVKILSYIIILQTGYGFKQLANFVSIYFGGYNPSYIDDKKNQFDPELNKKHKPDRQKIDQSIKKLDVRTIEYYQMKVLLEKYRKRPTNYVFSFGIPLDEILYSIFQFQKYKAAKKDSVAVKLNIIICQTTEEKTFMFFDPELHTYLFYSILTYLDSSNSIGFITRNNKTFMLKYEEDTEYIFGTTKEHESIEICIVDGEISKSKENKYPYIESDFNISEVKKSKTVEITIEDPQNFGNPNFIIN